MSFHGSPVKVPLKTPRSFFGSGPSTLVCLVLKGYIGSFKNIDLNALIWNAMFSIVHIKTMPLQLLKMSPRRLDTIFNSKLFQGQQCYSIFTFV